MRSVTKTNLTVILALAAVVHGGTVGALASTVSVTNATALNAALAQATPGTTINLAPGTYAGTARIPAGITLRGAGHTRTFLDVGMAEVGLALAGDGARVTALTVTSEGATAILAQGVKRIQLSGVLVRGGAVGIRVQQADDVRVENCIVDGSLTGLAIDEVTRASIVNNTLTRTDSVGISLARVSATAVFNNVVAHAGVAVSISQPGADLRLDHNLYLALLTGKLDGQHARISLGPWRDVSGFDAQSVSLPVVFQDAAQGDYQPVSMLDWHPGVPTTAGWGVARLGNSRAPEQDIAGADRPAIPGVGAREGVGNPAIAVDGTFVVKSSRRTKSAGVFRRDGTLVRYLFHNLPLAKGRHGFVLPSRSELGAVIEPGDYELRLVESELRWDYRMLTANNGVGTRLDESDPGSVMRVGWSADQHLVLAGGWNERGENLRVKNLNTGRAVWSLPGNVAVQGLCTAADGTLYILQPGPTASFVSRLDPQGRLQQWPGGEWKLPVAVTNANGLAELNGELFLSSQAGGVYRLNPGTGDLSLAFRAAAPFHLVADRQRGWLWMIDGAQAFLGGTVTAFTPAGAMQHRLPHLTANPLGVAVQGDRLAVADYDAGQVRFFDIRDPAAPVPRGAIGRGDGPYGPVAPDRFWFQKGMYRLPREVPMTLDRAGRLALVDGSGRPIVFAADGRNLLMGEAQYGNAPYWAQFPGETSVTRFFDALSRVSWTIDARRGRWAPEAHWGRPELGLHGNTTVGFFKHQDHVFGVLRYTTADGKPKRTGYVVLRYENYVGVIVAFYCSGERGRLVVVRDENQDGAITEADGAGVPVLDVDGQPVRAADALARFSTVEANGNIHSQTFRYWRFQGVDGDNRPRYEFSAGPRVTLPPDPVSPYDFTTPVRLIAQSESLVGRDGDALITLQTTPSPHGMGLSNSGGIDLLRLRPDGTLRWYRPLNDFGPVQGIKQATSGFLLTSWGHQAEWIGLDEDGLSLGHLGFPPAANWGGYWVDHPDHYALFAGNDGKLHVAVGDYVLNGIHWLSLRNYDRYRKATYPFRLASARSAALAAQPPQTTFLAARAEKPRVTAKRLAAPLPIDGDLEKWRQLGWPPQIIITPATAGPGITSAHDCSAVIRVAYEGRHLYVQVLRFDDVPTFHHTVATGTHYQDTVEMMINGFHPDGFQFSVGKFAADGDQIVRRRFFHGNLQLTVPADVAPRLVRVLDNAAAVPERRLIEAATGENLEQAKVIVTEFKLPIDERTWAGSETTLFPVEPGKGFWLGFMIDDNDAPGTDLQQWAVWPATFTTFSAKEDSVWVVFE